MQKCVFIVLKAWCSARSGFLLASRTNLSVTSFLLEKRGRGGEEIDSIGLLLTLITSLKLLFQHTVPQGVQDSHEFHSNTNQPMLPDPTLTHLPHSASPITDLLLSPGQVLSLRPGVSGIPPLLCLWACSGYPPGGAGRGENSEDERRG